MKTPHWLFTIMTLLALAGLPAFTSSATAQQGICHPDTGVCLNDLFANLWNANGGLGGGLGPGYPISEMESFTFEGQSAQFQVTERAVYTYASWLPAHWQVQKGLLGDAYISCFPWEMILQDGDGPYNEMSATFGVGDQYPRISNSFRSVWNLQTWGWPRTNVLLRDGLVIQYFERGRLELHPTGEVLAGRLGALLVEQFGTGAAVYGCPPR